MDVSPSDAPAQLPPDPVEAPAHPSPTLAERAMAVVEVVLCSDVPTQFLSSVALMAVGLRPAGPDGQLRISFVAPMLALDSLLLIGLMLFFLHRRGEPAGPLFFGHRSWIAEAKLALPAAVGALVVAGAVLGGVRLIAPWLHTVDRNPFEGLAVNPASAALFAVVGMIGGGVREEAQRAFVLHRFERYLGGRTVGLVVSSVAFGAGHFLQGADAAIATGVLGAYWGVLYLRRRSIVAPVLSHAAFNALQIGAFFARAGVS